MKSLALERSTGRLPQRVGPRLQRSSSRPSSFSLTSGNLLLEGDSTIGQGKVKLTQLRASVSASETETETDAQAMPAFEDFSALVRSGKYKGWLLDQFGVLHDGIKPYDHALELVKHLAEKEDTKLVILTNSARRAPHTLNRLERMGFQREWFVGVATSGDVAHRVLSLAPGQADTTLLPEDHPLWRDINPFQEEEEEEEEEEARRRRRRRRRCLHFTWEKHDLVHGIDLEDMGIDVTTDPALADFVLVHWFDTIAVEGNKELRPVNEEDIENLLVKCAERKLPMLVANPDIVACKGDKLLKMPGSLAVRYEELGVPLEKIHLLGKPSPIVYHWAQESFFSDLEKTSIIAVGDSLEHDIKGACRFEVDSAFITRGIHCDDLHECNVPEDAWNKEELERLCLEHNADPTICSEFFSIE